MVPNLIQRLAALRGAFELPIVSAEAKRRERARQGAAASPLPALKQRGSGTVCIPCSPPRGGLGSPVPPRAALGACSPAPARPDPSILPRHIRAGGAIVPYLCRPGLQGLWLGLLLIKRREMSCLCSKMI